MDCSIGLADESGIPFLSSVEDIPVHSTPIKGANVPLPSTKHMMKHYVAHPRRELVESESAQSVRSHDPQVKGQGQMCSYSSDTQLTEQRYNYKHNDNDFNTVRLFKTSENHDTVFNNLSNIDNLRPRPKDLGYEMSSIDTTPRQEVNTHIQLRSDSANNCELVNDTKVALQRISYEMSDVAAGDSPASEYGSKNVRFIDDRSSIERPHLTNNDRPHLTNNERPHLANTERPHLANNERPHLTNNERPLLTDDRNSIERPNPTDNHSSLERPTLTDDRSALERLSRLSPTPERKHRFSRPSSANKDIMSTSSFTELENTTLQKQRQEIQLLVSELKARDHELSDMASAHQQQLNTWEQDRHRLETLDKKCVQYEHDLRKKSMHLRSYMAHLKALQKKELDTVREMDRVQSTLDARTSEAHSYRNENDECKMQIGSLKSQVQVLNEDIAEVHIREKDLINSLRLKETDISSATCQVSQLSERIQHLEVRCREIQEREKEALKCTADWRERCENCHQEINILKGELDKKRKEACRLAEENRSARQQLSLIQKEKEMMETSKDEVIDSMKIKQERTDSQLKNFRELYERQIKDVALMQIKLDTTKEVTQRQLDCSDQQLSDSYHASQMSDYSWDTSTGSRFPGQHKSQHSTGREPVCTESQYSQQSQSSGYQSQLVENQTAASAAGDQHASSLHSSSKHYQGNHSQSQVYNSGSQSASRLACLEEERSHSSSSSHTAQNSGSNHSSSSSSHPVSSRSSEHRLKSPADSVHSPATPDNYLIHDAAQRQAYSEGKVASDKAIYSQVANPVLSTNQQPASVQGKAYSVPDTDRATSRQPRSNLQAEVEQDASKRYAFNNKLCSFLDDLGEIDDNIWDEDQSAAPSSINFSKSLVDTSPASKLRNLLVESQQMILDLEKSDNTSRNQSPRTYDAAVQEPRQSSSTTQSQ